MDPIILIYTIFVVVLGASIGSFINVVIFRLPEGMSLVSPPSHCPACKYHLAWYDNIPIVSWFVLDAKCRKCGAKISEQYPIIEGVTAGIITLLFVLYYAGVSHQTLYRVGPENSAIIFVTHMILIAALVAATVIDARLFIIPMELPWVIGITALVLQPLSSAISLTNYYVVPTASGHAVGIAFGAAIGLVISNVLLIKKILPRSFEIDENGQWIVNGKPAGPAIETVQPNAPEGAESARPDAPLPPPVAEAAASAPTPAAEPAAAPVPPAAEGAATPDAAGAPAAVTAEVSPLPAVTERWLRHPNPRGEMTKELLFLALPLLGAIIGYFLMPKTGPEGRVTDIMGGEHVVHLVHGWTNMPMGMHILAGTLLGGVVGGAVVWLFRIAGTYLFGREAMGMGDVHLMAAIGTVVGGPTTIFIFFLAAVLGLLGTIATGAANNMLAGKQRFREIPFGPYIAGATVLALLFNDPVQRFVGNVTATIGVLFSGRI